VGITRQRLAPQELVASTERGAVIRAALCQLSVCQFVLRDESVMLLFSNVDVLTFNGQFDR
jgi:hypothetical protein